MKLKIEKHIPFYKGQIVARLEKNERNPALQGILKRIKDGGLAEFKNDEKLNYFTNHLIDDYKQRKLIVSDGETRTKNPLTDKGEEIVKTGMEFKTLDALFDVSFVENDRKLYMLGCEVSKSNGKQEKSNEHITTKSLTRTFEDTEYKIGSLTVKNVKPLHSGFMQKEEKSVKSISTYDFDKSDCKTEIFVNERPDTITTNDKNAFHLINSETARQELLVFLQDFIDSNIVSVADDNAISIEKLPDTENELLDDMLERIFETGFAELTTEDELESLEEIRLCLTNNVVKPILYKYLLQKATILYLGKEEVGRLVMQFPELFEKCPPVAQRTQDIYDELKKQARRTRNVKALLHLQAYQDLCPDDVLKDYVVRKSIDYSGKEKSWADIVSDLFGENRNIKSVTTMTKYAYENQGLTRGLCVIADILRKKYDVTLTVISCERQKNPERKLENRFWAGLKDKTHFIPKDFDSDLKEIHDRYWKIVREDGMVEWFKTSGEVDALRYENDFVGKSPRMNINAETRGTVKEMTVTFIAEGGILENIQKLFADCEEKKR